ncbi:MAG: type II toxin-antitoxin system RelE/ParE family toxin [Firmicutes bacterium]|nr:type II toxin-antitoxin system RelE/ParE family toxin [Bacillota bacterium]
MPESDFSIIVTVQAEAELIGVLDYISNVFYAKETAERILAKITKGFTQLKAFPHSAPLMDEPEYSGFGIHRLVVSNFSIFYCINEKKSQVEILHVLHGMQDYTLKLGKM